MMAPGTSEQLNYHGYCTPCSRPCHRTAAPLQPITTVLRHQQTQGAGSEHRWHCCRGLTTSYVGRAQNKWTRWLSRRSLCFQLIRKEGSCHKRHTQPLYTTNLPTFKDEEGKHQRYQFFMWGVNSDGTGSHAWGRLTKLDCEQGVSTGFIRNNITAVSIIKISS